MKPPPKSQVMTGSLASAVVFSSRSIRRVKQSSDIVVISVAKRPVVTACGQSAPNVDALTTVFGGYSKATGRAKRLAPLVSSPKRMLKKDSIPEDRFPSKVTPVEGLVTVGGADAEEARGCAAACPIERQIINRVR